MGMKLTFEKMIDRIKANHALISLFGYRPFTFFSASVPFIREFQIMCIHRHMGDKK